MDIALVLQAANRQSERCGKAFILLSQARFPAAPASAVGHFAEHVRWFGRAPSGPWHMGTAESLAEWPCAAWG